MNSAILNLSFLYSFHPLRSFLVGGVHYCFEVKITETLDYSSFIETIYTLKVTKQIKMEPSISPFCGFINTPNLISCLYLCKTPFQFKKRCLKKFYKRLNHECTYESST